MAVTTMKELFEHELRDMYYAENHLVKALEKMVKETSDAQLRAQFAEHKRETQGHVKRLERVFALVGRTARPITCHGIAGLIEEKKSFAKEKAPKDINDFNSIGASIKIERYEISAYENLIHIAREHLHLPEAIEILESTLAEERGALDNLQAFLASHSPADMEREAVPA